MGSHIQIHEQKCNFVYMYVAQGIDVDPRAKSEGQNKRYCTFTHVITKFHMRNPTRDMSIEQTKIGKGSTE